MVKFPIKQAHENGYSFSSTQDVPDIAYLFKNSANPGLSYEYMRQNGIEVNIHFSSLTHTLIETSLKYSLIDTISAFGGLCGLMVGASLLTSVEIVFLLVDIILCFIISASEMFLMIHQN